MLADRFSEQGPDDSETAVAAAVGQPSRVDEALPATPAYAGIKARTVAMIYDGNPGEMFDGMSADCRLTVQVLRPLAAQGRHPI